MSESINPLGTGWQPPAGSDPAPAAPAPEQQSEPAAPAVAGQAPAETSSDSAAGTTDVESGDDSDDGQGGEQQRPQGKNWAGRKIDNLTRQLEDERRERIRATEIAREVLRQAGVSAPAAAPRQQQPAPPRREDFTDIETYFERRAEYAAEQKARQMFDSLQRNAAAEQQQAAERANALALAQSFQSKMDASAKAYPDFKRVVLEEGAHVPVGNAAVALAQSENPAGVMIYLAQNPERAERIAQMHPVSAAREIGKIEASLTKPQVSNAPPPGRPNGSRPSASAVTPPDNHTSDQYMAWAAKHLK
jgi:hypothetical protein